MFSNLQNNQRDKQIIGLFYLLSRYMFYLAIEIVNQSEKISIFENGLSIL